MLLFDNASVAIKRSSEEPGGRFVCLKEGLKKPQFLLLRHLAVNKWLAAASPHHLCWFSRTPRC